MIYGAEGKIEIPKWGRFSGYRQLFLYGGQCLVSGHRRTLSRRRRDQRRDSAQPDIFPIRRISATRCACACAIRSRLGCGWPDRRNMAADCRFEFTGTYAAGARAVRAGGGGPRRFCAAGGCGLRLPSVLQSAPRCTRTITSRRRFQADFTNLNNRLNVIDFGGLFSGNAIAPPRSYALRLQTPF